MYKGTYVFLKTSPYRTKQEGNNPLKFIEFQLLLPPPFQPESIL